MIKKLADIGLSRIEATSFVSPKWVPQMADAAEICQFCRELNIAFIALTPNVKALNQAIEQQVPQIAIFVGASTTFNKKNINRTTEEYLAECELLFQIAQRQVIFIRAYISTAFFCPYQGRVSFVELNDVCRKFVELGADEIDIGDTNGFASPMMVYDRFSRLRELYPDTSFVGHFHDTRKMALANTLAALQAGVVKFDSSIGGLGGCPFSPGATGNLATEDLVLMLSEMGIQTKSIFKS
ncbi:hydroxymethylglutaryl-CoA lyase [Bacillus sp. JJ722]|uniref:hydroxymethylglutaryl-CoA lyase n=1 Tax=Bacillus sp. JJ722 TaxID=3122973 RepID=UPI0030007FC2